MGMATENSSTAGVGAADGEDRDIKNLMDTVVAQFAAADRRNADLLRAMQGRLDALGEQARASRPSVPPAFRPGFERIEDGLALLADKIAETSQGLAHDEPAASMPVVPTPAPIDAISTPTSNPDAPIEVISPQPLKSASFGFAAPNRPSHYGANIDTFDVIDSRPGNPSEPWEPDDIDALTRVYEGHQGAFAAIAPSVPAPAERPASAVHRSVARPSADTPPEPVAPTLAVDRDWLDQRFTEIARRIEQSQAANSLDQAVAALGNRFEVLERQMTTALRGVATIKDVSGLALIEAHIGELTTKFDLVQAELCRLDGLEAKLGSVLDFVSNDRWAAVADATDRPATAPSSLELHGVAIAAAEAAASRAAQSVAGLPGRSVGDVHALLAGLVAERRQGEEQTAAVLDSLQQAMVRLLDRIEGGDTAQSAGTRQSAEAVPARLATSAVMKHDVEVPADEIVDEPGDAESREADLGDLDSAHRWFDDKSAVDCAPAELSTGPQHPQPALDSDLALIADPIARQRAMLQASAQRAALAQRERAAAQQQSALGSDGRTSPSARVPRGKPIGAGLFSPRQMVSGAALVMCALAGAAGVNLMMSHSNQTDLATVSPAATAASNSLVPATDASGAPTLNQPKIENAAKTAPMGNGSGGASSQAAANRGFAPASVPQTVTDDLGGPAEVPEVGLVPERGVGGTQTEGQGNLAIPKPMSGILIQDRPGAVDTSNGRPVADEGSAKAMPIVASSEDAVPGRQAGTADEQSRPALGLPPATVGPLSLRLAAANGDASAEFEVASRLAEGKGTDQNLALAARWYQRAATKGFAQAQYRLGALYERGLGVAKDPARARSWYQRAAEQGNVKAMHNLAVLAAGRSGQPPDYETAAKWFASAARFGLADSQFNLAVLTESGLGVHKDTVQAAGWYTLAAKAGDREAIRRRDSLKAQLSKTELAAADAFVASWQSDVPEKLVNDASFAGQAWKTRAVMMQPGNG